MTSSRFIRARVVGPIEFAGENRGVTVSGPKRKLSKKERQIRQKLRRARALKRRIAHLRIRKPLGWKGAVKRAKTNLRIAMSDLRALGWKPKKPRRALKPGEDEMDAALEDIPEAEPGETEESDEDIEELPESPEAETEGNWLDGHVGAEPKKRPVADLFKKAGQLLQAKWSKPVPLGDGGQIQTKPGQRAMIMAVSPGLFVVQLVSDAAAQKLAGDNVGVLPLVLYPLVKSKILQRLVQPPAPAAQPAAAPAAQPAPVGCDDRRCGG
ncbi:MAG: hypothetical protein ACK4N5_09765 [Myxococcales bacterium]